MLIRLFLLVWGVFSAYRFCNIVNSVCQPCCSCLFAMIFQRTKSAVFLFLYADFHIFIAFLHFFLKIVNVSRWKLGNCIFYLLNVAKLCLWRLCLKCLELDGLGIGAVSVSENTPQAWSEAGAGAAESPTVSGTQWRLREPPNKYYIYKYNN